MDLICDRCKVNNLTKDVFKVKKFFGYDYLCGYCKNFLEKGEKNNGKWIFYMWTLLGKTFTRR